MLSAPQDSLDDAGSERRSTAILYIDGFNLYRRCLEQHPALKWLDLRLFAENVLPEFRVVKVFYFTARVKPGASPDGQANLRQDVYLRALRTLAPMVEVVLGTFRIDRRPMAKHPVEVDPQTGEFVRVWVRKVEEKGSDVNLAVRMIADAHANRADYYVLLSNDSDQEGTLRVLKQELGVSTGIVFPMETARYSKALMKTGPDHVGYVTQHVLAASQLPERMADVHGKIHRPPTWTGNSEGPSLLGPSNR